MAATGIFHHVGTFLLFAASILILITTISAPVINDISMVKVTLSNSSTIRHSSITFGTFGFCVLDVAGKDADQDYCTKSVIGYNPALEVAKADNTDFSTASENTSKALTRVMILHPILCGMAFIAFLLALGSGICGALLAALVSGLTWALSVVVLATDFTLFGIIRNHVNGNSDDSGSHAKFGPAIWTLLAAMILLFFATFIVLFTCFSARRHKKQNRVSKHETGYGNGTTTTTHKRRFWQRRNRY